MNRRKQILIALCCNAVSVPVLAQDAPAPEAGAVEGIGDIVVTAEKRTSSVQKTPISITALSGDELAKKGLTSIEQIGGSVPAVAINNEAGTVKINIRGLGLNSYGPGTEGNVAVHTNGVYLAHAVEFGSQLLDVQRLEILRGPQGTLYGRNSTGGAINIIPNAPTNELSAGGSVTYGNYNAVLLNGFVSAPIIKDVLKFRIAGQYERHDGWLFNAFNGTHVMDLSQGGFRGALEYTPNENVKLTVSADWFHGADASQVNIQDGYGRQQVYAAPLVAKAVDPVAAAAAFQTITTDTGLPSRPPYNGITNPVGPDGRSLNPNVVYQDKQPFGKRTYWGGLAILDVAISDTVSLKSVTGYRQGKFRKTTDGDRTTAFVYNYTQFENWRTFSEELQLIGDTDKLQWILGGYYLHDSEPRVGYILPTVDIGLYDPYGSTKTDALAIFGQLTYSFTPELKFTVGGRYSDEKRTRKEYASSTSTVTLQPDSLSFSKFTPKFTLQYEPSNKLNFYATVSNGFKSGGFLITAGQGPLEPETLWDYEVGAKVRLFDNRLNVNLSAYHYDYKNLQVPVNNALSINTQNAAAARINGGELEVTALPIDDLRLTASGAIIDGKFTDYISKNPIFPELGLINLKGNELPFNSKYSFFVEAEYTLHLANGGSIQTAASYTWRSKRYFDAFNLRNNYSGSVGLLDGRIRYEVSGGKLYAELFGKNLTNKFYFSQLSANGEYFGQQLLGQREAPRTYGVRLGFKY